MHYDGKQWRCTHAGKGKLPCHGCTLDLVTERDELRDALTAMFHRAQNNGDDFSPTDWAVFRRLKISNKTPI